MIVAENPNPSISDFSLLMRNVDSFLNKEALINPKIINNQGGTALEPIVFDATVECARGTLFEGTITKAGGSHFPDIVAAKYYGIEVKSTNKDHWTSIGSSILESTRVEDIDRIFLTFGKLNKPIEFRSRPYEECLSGIAVTHYPRYQIDMTLQPGQTIFDKMGVPYEELRVMDNPVIPVANYYRQRLKPGESLWWAGNKEDEVVPATVKIWASLYSDEKDRLEAKGYVLFPESILGKGQFKYARMVLWLATKYGIINPNIRDSYSAGGKKTMKDENGLPHEMPAIFKKIKDHIGFFKDIILNTEKSTLSTYWEEPIENNRVLQWIKLVINEEKDEKDRDLAESVLRRVFIDSGMLK